MVIFGVDSIFGSKNVISESSELRSFGQNEKKRCFWMFSQSTVLGTTSYLVKAIFESIESIRAQMQV